MIPLGYELGSGKRVDIPLGHLVVTGQTQKSGKTTTLEALISRSGLRAVAFITKRGEKSFRLMTPIAPYFQERADWQFVQALLETSMKTKMDFKQAWIMRAADGAATLENVRNNIRRFLNGEYEDVPAGKKKKKRVWSLKPARGLNADMYYVLDQYFEEVMPQVKNLKGSKTLKLARGVNVMDLSEYTFPMQALVIRSVLERIYEHEHGVIVIIPEAWEFIPEGRRSPVRLAAEELIRKGAAEKNYVWLDSQDIAGVAKVMLRQMEVWIFGVQRDPRELKRTLESLPDLPRPKASDIALLGKGQFIVAYGQEVTKVYVQPAGMEDAHAQAIARGEERPESWTQIVRSLDAESGESRPSDRSLVGRHAADLDIDRQNHRPRGDPALQEEAPPLFAEKEDEMWKEKYNGLISALAKALGCDNDPEAVVDSIATLKRGHDALAERIRLSEAAGETVLHVPSRIPPAEPASSNGEGSLDAIYRYVVNRAAKEKEPAIISLLVEHPELMVDVERKVIDIDYQTVPGAIAKLIADRFFDLPHNGYQTFLELQRRGRKCAKVTVNQALSQVAEMGFLTREEEGYLATPGMKVTVKTLEAGA